MINGIKVKGSHCRKSKLIRHKRNYLKAPQDAAARSEDKNRRIKASDFSIRLDTRESRFVITPTINMQMFVSVCKCE